MSRLRGYSQTSSRPRAFPRSARSVPGSMPGDCGAGVCE